MVEDEKSTSDGIAVAIALLIGGGLCFFAPKYFSADGWGQSAWYVAGILTALIGAVGLISELTDSKEIGDFAVGIVCLGLALGLALLLVAWEAPSPVNGSIRVLVAFFLFFGIYGSAAGVHHAILDRRKRDAPPITFGKAAAAVSVALLGLITAGVNLYAALAAKTPTP